MRVYRVLPQTFAEGPGRRFCIWVQGCAHGCDGCFAEPLWDPDGGYACSPADLIAQIRAVADDIRGITLLGGEPFDQAEELTVVARAAQEMGKDVLAFSGYTIEVLRRDPAQNALLDFVDLLIDGKYDRTQPETERPLAGSRNQRFLFLTERIHPQEIAAYKNRFEIRVQPSGSVLINGMGDPETLRRLRIGNGGKNDRITI